MNCAKDRIDSRIIFVIALWFLPTTLVAEDITLSLWHQMRPGDRAILSERLQEYEANNPGIEVRALYKETEELRSGLESAVLVGRGPDIIYGPSDTIGVYDQIGGLQDLTPWFDTEIRSEFDPEALVEVKPNSIKQGTEPETRSRLLLVGDRFGNHLALIFNKRLVPEPPKTNVELLEIAQKATLRPTPSSRPTQYGLVWNYTEPFFAIPFFTGYGAWVFDADKAKQGEFIPTLDTPEAQAGFAFVADLRNKYKVLPESADYENAEALFLAGKAAMIINGDWSWARYLDAKGIEAVVSPLPMVVETGLPMAPMVAPKGYSMSVVAKGERAEAAGKLIRYLTSEATQERFLANKILPSRLKLRESPLLLNDPTMVASLQQVKQGKPMPTSLEMRAVWDAMRPPYQELMSGSITPAEATTKMQQGAISKIATLTENIQPDGSIWLVRIAGLLALAAVGYGLARWIRLLRADFLENQLAYLLSFPAMLLIFLTVVFPLAYNVMLSFSNMSLQNFSNWQIVGLHNYVDVFVGKSSAEFWGVFFKTIYWTVVNVSLHVAIGVFLAVILNGPVWGKSIYRILLVIPWAVPAYITALTWRGMFDTEFGAVNQLVMSINDWLPSMLQLPIVNWLNEAGPAFTACIVANVWLGFPFMMVITLGGLQGIPQDLYEAARIDRATRWQQFWHITVPMLKPVLLPAIVLGSVWTFNNLNVVWLVSNGGEPADQTHILVSYVYQAVFNLYQYGYGAALSMVIFAMLLAFSAVFLRQTKADEGV